MIIVEAILIQKLNCCFHSWLLSYWACILIWLLNVKIYAGLQMPPLLLDEDSDKEGAKLMMMIGMTAKDFDPVRYLGRWFEVASLNWTRSGRLPLHAGNCKRVCVVVIL